MNLKCCLKKKSLHYYDGTKLFSKDLLLKLILKGNPTQTAHRVQKQVKIEKNIFECFLGGRAEDILEILVAQGLPKGRIWDVILASFWYHVGSILVSFW